MSPATVTSATKSVPGTLPRISESALPGMFGPIRRQALIAGGVGTLLAFATIWSPMFGMCVDRFGTPWMVSAESNP